MGRKRAYKIGKSGFRQADELVAVDAAIMFQAFILPDRYLCSQAMMDGVNGGADNS